MNPPKKNKQKKLPCIMSKFEAFKLYLHLQLLYILITHFYLGQVVPRISKSTVYFLFSLNLLCTF